MDKPIESTVEIERAEVAPVETTEISPEEMSQVAGGQNGAGSGPPH
jgi:hypothetical protein